MRDAIAGGGRQDIYRGKKTTNISKRIGEEQTEREREKETRLR